MRQLALALVIGCLPVAAIPQEQQKPVEQADTANFKNRFAEEIEETYGRQTWESKKTLRAEITISFGGNVTLDGVLIMKPDTSGVRIEKRDGSVLVWDGSHAWVSEGASPNRARFSLLTWPYFLAMPFKLRDPGTHMRPAGSMTADEKQYDVGKLTFSEGVGDAPDDWYYVYKNPDNSRVEHLAYIVSYGKEKDALKTATVNSISYYDFVEVDGVTLPTTWRFRKWDEATGPGAEVGNAKLKNLEFIEPEAEMFTAPPNATEDPLPKP